MREVKLVGILNLTPDSFSDGGEYIGTEVAVRRTADLFREGASMVDIGAESTRPGATVLSPEEEWQRLEPILQAVVPGYTDSISVDTYHPETVHRVAAEVGPVVVNDVTGMNNPLMVEAVASLGLRCILSHLPAVVGQDIQKGHDSKPVDSINQVIDELSVRIEELEAAGIDPGSILVDPGFGFGKAPELNAELLRLPRYMSGHEFYIGVSRKSSLKRRDFYKEELADFSSMDPKQLRAWLDNRSVEVAKEAAANGFTYLRVHNVAAHRELL